jgi:hypothetical protein
MPAYSLLIFSNNAVVFYFFITHTARAEEELNAHSKFTNQLFDSNDSQQNGPTFVAVVSAMYLLFIINCTHNFQNM